ncbi:hypothetical protein Tco_0748907 [Tanacetum coccineum]|uniref:Uncharacterized protein n=1 Tax=Tanacetum coccineum TaxID=301880 RepID=A0ABQ4YZG7_9ASTR
MIITIILSSLAFFSSSLPLLLVTLFYLLSFSFLLIDSFLLTLACRLLLADSCLPTLACRLLLADSCLPTLACRLLLSYDCCCALAMDHPTIFIDSKSIVVEHAQGLSDRTASRFIPDKSMILCFKCKGYGHFANKFPLRKQGQSSVSIKYPEFVHFKTRGILKGTGQDWMILQQGFEIIFEGDKCILEYMFKDKKGTDWDWIRWAYAQYVDFSQEFGAIAEILGLTREDGEKIKGCYMNYLDIFTSYYKTARTPQIPTNVEEGSESLESYQWNKDRTGATLAARRKEKI